MYGEPNTDDDDRDKRLLSLLESGEAPAYAPPVAETMPQFEAPPRVDLEAPPERESPGIAPTLVGGVLDVLINKGRGLPGIVAGLGKGDDVPYENWKRRKEWAQAVNGGSRFGSPQSMFLRQQEAAERRRRFDESIKQREIDRGLRKRGFDQGDQRIAIAQGGQKLKEDAQERDLNPDNPQLLAMKQYAYSLGAPAGSLDGMDAKAVRDVKTLLEKDMETRGGSPLAQQDIAHDAATAGATSHATLPDRLAIASVGAGNAADLDAIKREREQQDKIADEQRKRQQYEIALENLEKNLTARAAKDPNARLPGSENIAVRGLHNAQNLIMGEGAAYNEEDAALNSDLSALGGQAFMEAFHNAPNATPEQARAMAMFRGNGSVSGALARTRQKRAEIAQKRAMEDAGRAQPASGASAATPSHVSTKPLTPEEEDDALKGLGL